MGGCDKQVKGVAGFWLEPVTLDSGLYSDDSVGGTLDELNDLWRYCWADRLASPPGPLSQCFYRTDG